jgi:hypothetical protein
MQKATFFTCAVLACAIASAQTQTYNFSGVVTSTNADLNGIPIGSTISGTFTLALSAAVPAFNGTVSPGTTLSGGTAGTSPLLLTYSATALFSDNGLPPYSPITMSSSTPAGAGLSTPVEAVSSLSYQSSGGFTASECVAYLNNSSICHYSEASSQTTFSLMPSSAPSVYFSNGLLNPGAVSLGANSTGSIVGSVFGGSNPQYLGAVYFNLTSLTPAVAALPQVININAAASGYYNGAVTDPLEVTLNPGCYTVSDAFGRDQGATYGALNYHVGVPNDWAWQYRVVNVASLVTLLYVAAPTNESPATLYSTQSAASAAGQALPAAEFCLRTLTTVGFVIDDNYLPDNTGGISLLIAGLK